MSRTLPYSCPPREPREQQPSGNPINPPLAGPLVNGILQGSEMYWPCSLNGAPTSLSSQRLGAAPTPAPIQWPQKSSEAADEGDDNRESRILLPPPPSPVYSFSGEDDTPPDNFIQPEKVRLNVFQTEPTAAEPTSSAAETVPYTSARYEPDSENAAPETSESRARIARRPLRTVKNVSYYRPPAAANRTMESTAPNENIRMKPGQRHDSSIQTYSKITPAEETYRTTATNYEQYNGTSDKASNYDYNQIEKEFKRSPAMGKMPEVMADPRKSSGLAMNRYQPSRYGSSEQLAGPPAYSWRQQQQQYKSTPDLREVQSPPAYSMRPESIPIKRTQKEDDWREVPEQMYHLYQTRDAFGNLLAQCEMEIETDEQLLSRLSLNAPPELSSNERDFVENLGLPLTPDYSSEGVTGRSHLTSHPESAPKYPENVPEVSSQQHFIDVSNDADTLRRACSSLYRRSVAPVSQMGNIPTVKRVRESATSNFSHGAAHRIRKPKVISTDESSLELSNNQSPEKAAARSSTEEQSPEKAENLEGTAAGAQNSGENAETAVGVKGSSSSTSDLVAQGAGNSPTTKSILHTSARRSSLRKKVRFPPEQPQVIAVDHRLLIANPDLV